MRCFKNDWFESEGVPLGCARPGENEARLWCHCVRFHALCCRFQAARRKSGIPLGSICWADTGESPWIITVYRTELEGNIFDALNVDACNPSYPSLSLLFISSYKVIQLFCVSHVEFYIKAMKHSFPLFQLRDLKKKTTKNPKYRCKVFRTLRNILAILEKIFIMFLPEFLLPMIRIMTWLSGPFSFNCVVLSPILR